MLATRTEFLVLALKDHEPTSGLVDFFVLGMLKRAARKDGPVAMVCIFARFVGVMGSTLLKTGWDKVPGSLARQSVRGLA